MHQNNVRELQDPTAGIRINSRNQPATFRNSSLVLQIPVWPRLSYIPNLRRAVDHHCFSKRLSPPEVFAVFSSLCSALSCNQRTSYEYHKLCTRCHPHSSRQRQRLGAECVCWITAEEPSRLHHRTKKKAQSSISSSLTDRPQRRRPDHQNMPADEGGGNHGNQLRDATQAFKLSRIFKAFPFNIRTVVFVSQRKIGRMFLTIEVIRFRFRIQQQTQGQVFPLLSVFLRFIYNPALARYQDAQSNASSGVLDSEVRCL